MPRPKNPGGYPVVYGEMIELVASTTEAFMHKCTDNKAAQHLRFVFYDYIKACRKSDKPHDQQIAKYAESLIFTVRDEHLIIRTRDAIEDSLGLRQTMEEYKKKCASDDPNPAYEKIKAKRNQQVKERTAVPNFMPPADPNAPDPDDLVNAYLKDRK